MKKFKWTTQQKKALRDSINNKWIKLANGTKRIENRGEDCACCKIWNDVQKFCIGCPINKYTGQKYCISTPYIEWRNALDNWYCAPRKERKECAVKKKQAAETMVSFLKKVLRAGS